MTSKKVQHFSNGDLLFWCPGCKDLHSIAVGEPNEKGSKWSWNGDYDNLTVRPSILVTAGSSRRCHSFITEGVWEFQLDCNHKLAGQKVPMVDLPEWAQK